MSEIKFIKGDIINLNINCNSKEQIFKTIKDSEKEYKLKICSKPINNKANKEIIKFFKKLGYDIEFLKGLKANKKIIKIIDDPY